MYYIQLNISCSSYIESNPQDCLNLVGTIYSIHRTSDFSNILKNMVVASLAVASASAHSHQPQQVRQEPKVCLITQLLSPHVPPHIPLQPETWTPESAAPLIQTSHHMSYLFRRPSISDGRLIMSSHNDRTMFQDAALSVSYDCSFPC